MSGGGDDSPGAAPEPDAGLRREAWSRYWQTGALHSCAGSFSGNYGGAIGGLWRETFAGLPASCRVLDIATGNGPLLQLLLDRRVDPDIRAVGIDAAAIRPDWLRQRSATEQGRVRLLGNTAAEHLPFDDASFDLVISQFGIEYADLKLALGECLRVLRHDGRLCLVMHHAESRTLQLAREELRHLAWLEAPDGWLAHARRMITPMASLRTDAGRARLATDAGFNDIRERFDAAIHALRARADQSPCPDLLDDVQQWFAQVFRVAATEGEAQALAAAEAVSRTLQDIRARLTDLVTQALTPEAAHAAEAAVRATGRITGLRRLIDEDHLMGWVLRA